MGETKPICANCKDTHRVHYEDERGEWVDRYCQHCPTPCQRCRAGGIGAYCEKTPCDCACHAGHFLYREHAQRAAGVDASAFFEHLKHVGITPSTLACLAKAEHGADPTARMLCTVLRLVVNDAIRDSASWSERIKSLETRIEEAVETLRGGA
jgi:hypothetical protein